MTFKQNITVGDIKYFDVSSIHVKGEAFPPDKSGEKAYKDSVLVTFSSEGTPQMTEGTDIKIECLMSNEEGLWERVTTTANLPSEEEGLP